MVSGGGVESGRIGREGTSPHRRLRRHLPRGGRLPERARGAGCLAELLALGGVFDRADTAEGSAGGAVRVDGGTAGAGAVAEGGRELGEGGVLEEEVAAAGAGEIGGDARAREITKRVEIPDAGNKESARRATCFGDVSEVQEERGWGRGRYAVSILYGSWEGQGEVGSRMSDVGSGEWAPGRTCAACARAGCSWREVWSKEKRPAVNGAWNADGMW